jgi:hypothetical protein
MQLYKKQIIDKKSYLKEIIHKKLSAILKKKWKKMDKKHTASKILENVEIFGLAIDTTVFLVKWCEECGTYH